MLELLPTFPWEKKRWKSEFESFPPFKTLFFIFLFYDGTFQLFFGCFLSSFVTTHFQFTSISIQLYFNSFSLVFPVFVQLITILVSSLVSFHINSYRFRFKVPNKTEWTSKTVQSSKKRSFLTSVEMTRWQRRVENPLFNFLFLFLYFFLLSSCENLEQKKVGKYLLTCSRVVLNAQRHFMFSDVFFISNGVVSFSSQKNCGSCRRN